MHSYKNHTAEEYKKPPYVKYIEDNQDVQKHDEGSIRHYAYGACIGLILAGIIIIKSEIEKKFPAVAITFNPNGDIFVDKNSNANIAKNKVLSQCKSNDFKKACSPVIASQAGIKTCLTFQSINLANSTTVFHLTEAKPLSSLFFKSSCTLHYTEQLKTNSMKPFDIKECDNTVYYVCNYAQ